MVLEAVETALSVYGLIKDIHGFLVKENLQTEIDKAYKNALKGWCKNNEIRRKIASRYSDSSVLASFIAEDGRITTQDPEFSDVLRVWELELRNNAKTAAYLNSILAKKGISIAGAILDQQVLIKKEIEEIGEEIRDIKRAISPTAFKFPIYDAQSHYIRRKVRDYNNVDHIFLFLNPDQYQPKALIDYLITDDKLAKRVVLYSEAQLGKSTELKQLAYETQESELFNTYLYELKSYTGGPLLDNYKLAYLCNYTNRKLLILDGLDEVKDELRPDAINQIEALALDYPSLSIVVSCRGNFEETNKIEKFSKLYLNPIDLNEVKTYINSNCDRPEQLIEAIEQNELYSLVYNPFYLQSIIEHYSEKGTLPETKPAIYEYVIEKSLQVDQMKRRGQVVGIKHVAMPLLQKIAFCMQFTEHLSFTYKELTQGLSLSEPQVESCAKYTIFKKDPGDNYSYTHNSFKEYLTAKHLSGISFEALKPAICYPDTDILRPNLYNTVVLLVSILDKNSPLLFQLIGWLAENKPEVLFLCEHHFLTEERSVEIFKSYFERLKRYGEHLNYQLWEKTMAFSNVRETILYLVNETKNGKELSSHFCNVITMLQYADMTLLSDDEQDDVYELGCKLISKHRDNKGIQYVLFHIPNNIHFKSPARIAKLHYGIIDYDNPLLLNQFFKLVQEGGLSDSYIDWIISKRDCIHNYQEGSTTHIVSKDEFVDVLMSVKKIDNIIKALGQYDFVASVHFDKDKRSEILSRIFDNLHAVPQADISKMHIDTILAMLREEHLINYIKSDTSDVKMREYRRFFFERNIDEAVFSQYYATLKKEVLSPTLSNADQTDFLQSHLNVLAVLITDERFEQMMSDSDLSDEQRFWWIANMLGEYENISCNLDWNNHIEALRANQSPRIDFTKKAQDGFNILFDHDNFISELRAIAETDPLLSTDAGWRHKLWIDGKVDESVSIFIWRYGEKDNEDKIVMSEVVSKANDLVIFDDFLFHRLNEYLKQKIEISSTQQSKVNGWISYWVNNLDRCKDIHLLAHLIGEYKVQLSDDQLLSLVPHSYVAVIIQTAESIWHDKTESSLLLYIYENISDNKKVIAEIERILNGNEHLWPPLFETLAEFIVQKKITELYKYFDKMLFCDVDEGWRGGYCGDYPLRIANTVLKLGQDGFRILDPIKGKFSNNDRLYYYQVVIRDNSLRQNNSAEIVADLHRIIGETDTEHGKKFALSLLSELGDPDGLKMIVECYRSDGDRFLYGCPTLVTYGEEHVEIIKQLFEISHRFNMQERMCENSFNWLNRFAMQSTEKRDSVIAYYKKLSENDPVKYFYLLKVARNLDFRYFEENSPSMPIHESVRLYQSLLS